MGRTTNRWTRAAGACFATCLVRRCVIGLVPPHSLVRGYTRRPRGPIDGRGKSQERRVHAGSSPLDEFACVADTVAPPAQRASGGTKVTHNKSLAASGGSVFLN